jgi:glutamate carboxypeptidase
MVLLDYLRQHTGDMAEDLRAFVTRESPSDHKESLDAFADFLAAYARDFGNPGVEIVPRADAGNHVRVSWPGASAAGPLLFLGHYDTVWPLGTLSEIPFSIDGGIARGPGVFDMKSGLVQGFWAIRALLETGSLPRPIVMLCNSDEEVGSPSSRALIEEAARRSAVVFVLEPSEAGALKTARKAVGLYRVSVEGRASHAGLDPFGGVSAIEELARITLDVQALGDRERGVSVTVGTVRGGTRTNVVPAYAEAMVDVRAVTQADAKWIDERIRAVRGHHPDATVTITGGINRPAMERGESTRQLFECARVAASAELGVELREIAVGGGSDGNFCAAVGVPVLDGLGAVGGGAHARSEHAVVAQMPMRAALVAALASAPDLPGAER